MLLTGLVDWGWGVSTAGSFSDPVTRFHVQGGLIAARTKLYKHGRLLHLASRLALRVVGNKDDLVVSDVSDYFFVLAFLVGLRPAPKCVIVCWRAVDQLSDEVCVAVEHFLGCQGVYVTTAIVSLRLQEVGGFEKDEVDFLEDLEVDIDQTLLAGFTFLKGHEITRVYRVLQIQENFLNVVG